MFAGAKVIPLGHQQLTLTTGTVQGLNLTGITGICGVVLNAETQNVRFRDDGQAPTSSTGFVLRTTDPPLEYIGPLKALQFIGASSGALLNVAIYRFGGG